ncbi:MAG: glycosyltransferase family 4 protein [Candidatus Methanoperedens sp.]|nr:glycosyltransferase family 4 protein [Candidatus Methanoperedens sp.]
MKIALLSTWFPPFIVGSGNRFYEVGRRLSRSHELHIYTTGIDGCVDEEYMEGMHIHRYGIHNISNSVEKESYVLNLKFSLHLLKKNLELIQKNNKFDIIDCNIVSKTLPYASYFISKSTHVPLVETWHEVWYKENFGQYSSMMAIPGFYLELYMPKLSDFNIAVSETTKRRLIDLLKVNPNKISVISNGVDLKKFNGVSAEKKHGRILYVGRLESHKCIDTLLLAYHQLKKGYKDIELILIGKGPQRENLENLAQKLNLKDITFLDPMPYDQLIATMKSSWILVLPSIREGQGIVLLEAMAAGTPPIAVKAEGSAVGDVIKDNYNGLLVPQGEIENAMQKLLTDEDLYTNLRKNGLEFVKDYDWDKIAQRTAEIYEMVKRTQ